MLIRHHNALKGPKFDTKFAIPTIRAIKKYNKNNRKIGFLQILI
ncbi:hypothetical protein [uncultured Methanosphaera sp.]|nr:hypothetical protein [uncultured Methanosphaera sp.]